MSAPYRLYGAELSPYSIKVRSALRYKDIPHQWLARTAAREAEFQRFAKLPLVPVLVGSDDYSHQDSTPILETLERRYPEPSIAPDDRALQFVSILLEDYADEWVNKAMFHYRWTYPADQDSAAGRIVDGMFDGAAPDARADIVATVRERMVGRLHHVGSNPATGPVIEASFLRLIELLDIHLAGRSYLFGGRPALADFGLASQLGQLLSDPTPGAALSAKAPRVAAWIARMDAPAVEGPFETLDAMRSTIAALLRLEIAGLYLPWSAANAAAIQAGAPTMELELGGAMWSQAPQRYAAKALQELKRKRAFYSDDAALAQLMEETGCDAVLAVQPAALEPNPRPEPAGADAADPADAGDFTPRDAGANAPHPMGDQPDGPDPDGAQD